MDQVAGKRTFFDKNFFFGVLTSANTTQRLVATSHHEKFLGQLTMRVARARRETSELDKSPVGRRQWICPLRCSPGSHVRAREASWAPFKPVAVGLGARRVFRPEACLETPPQGQPRGLPRGPPGGPPGGRPGKFPGEGAHRRNRDVKIYRVDLRVDLRAGLRAGPRAGLRGDCRANLLGRSLGLFLRTRLGACGSYLPPP